MCTLVLAWQVFADYPVVVAANRDEALDRPSEPPTRIGEEPGVVAPRDADASPQTDIQTETRAQTRRRVEWASLVCYFRTPGVVVPNEHRSRRAVTRGYRSRIFRLVDARWLASLASLSPLASSRHNLTSLLSAGNQYAASSQ